MHVAAFGLLIGLVSAFEQETPFVQLSGDSASLASNLYRDDNKPDCYS